MLSLDEERELRKQLGQESLRHWACVYCGAHATEWDHLNPLVSARRPSGHLNVFGNLVPACGPCNHSKGGRAWRAWMMGGANGSPTSRGIQELETRAGIIEAYAAHLPRKITISELYESQDYERYWAKLDQIEALMREAQALADELRDQAEKKLS
jgi:hypothetical protein